MAQEQPILHRYVVLRAHDGREQDQIVELEGTGETMGQLSHGLLGYLEG